jgi:hypothetical protein
MPAIHTSPFTLDLFQVFGAVSGLVYVVFVRAISRWIQCMFKTFDMLPHRKKGFDLTRADKGDA